MVIGGGVKEKRLEKLCFKGVACIRKNTAAKGAVFRL
jgi:hypothetical protein